MSIQITLTLPDEVYQRVERLAQLSNRDVADVLTETIALLLPQLETAASISVASDEEVIALAQLQMPLDQDQQLSLLLDKQQAGILSESGNSHLQALMEIYQQSLLRKAKALHEAVKRGLRQLLEA